MPLGPDLNKFIKVFNLPIRDYTRLSVRDTQSAIEDYLDSLSSDADARKLQAKNNFPKLLAQYKKEGKVKRVPTEKGGFKKDPTAPKPAPPKPKPKKSPPPKPTSKAKETLKEIREKIPSEKPPRKSKPTATKPPPKTKTPPPTATKATPKPKPKEKAPSKSPFERDPEKLDKREYGSLNDRQKAILDKYHSQLESNKPKVKVRTFKQDQVKSSKLRKADQRTIKIIRTPKPILSTPTIKERDKDEAQRKLEMSQAVNLTIDNLIDNTLVLTGNLEKETFIGGENKPEFLFINGKPKRLRGKFGYPYRQNLRGMLPPPRVGQMKDKELIQTALGIMSGLGKEKKDNKEQELRRRLAEVKGEYPVSLIDEIDRFRNPLQFARIRKDQKSEDENPLGDTYEDMLEDRMRNIRIKARNMGKREEMVKDNDSTALGYSYKRVFPKGKRFTLEEMISELGVGMGAGY